MHLNLSRLLVLFSLGISFGAFGAPAPNEIRVGLAGFPQSTLYYLGFDDYSEAVSSLVLEPLVRLNLDTLNPEPALASHFSQNESLTRFVFEINPKARFSDGSPVTAQDVQFTWELLQRTGRQVTAYLAQFAEIQKCKVESPQRVVFISDKPLLAGLSAFSQLFILPQKTFSKGDFLKDFNETFMGSGPYLFKQVQWGKSISLEKNKTYWAQAESASSRKYFFDRIDFLIHSDPPSLLRLLLKHEIDYLYFLSARSWAKDTQTELFTSQKIKKLEVKNDIPFAMAGIAWNLRKPLFQDVRVREALSLLFNRQRLIQEFFFDQYRPSTGIANSLSPYHHPKNTPVPFHPERALEILKKAGWSLSAHKTLTKNGQSMTFEILTGNPPAAKFLAVYQEDLRKVGIRANIRVVDWGSYLKQRNSGQFDAIDFSRNRDENMRDLSMTWHSNGASDPQSGNVTGFSDSKVDSLLSELKKPLPEAKRVQVIQELDLIIAQAFPIAFSWEPKAQRIAYWDQFDFQKPGYFRFSRWNQLFHFWKRNDQNSGS